MAQKSYYVDTCIWLNLFKKEGDPTKGIPYWRIAEYFIENIIATKNEIVYSDQILKELKYKLANEDQFKARKSYLKEEFIFVKTTAEDYAIARKLESNSHFEISFYDCIHIAICLRLGHILITRDSALIKFANEYIKVKKPEEVFS